MEYDVDHRYLLLHPARVLVHMHVRPVFPLNIAGCRGYLDISIYPAHVHTSPLWRYLDVSLWKGAFVKTRSNVLAAFQLQDAIVFLLLHIFYSGEQAARRASSVYGTWLVSDAWPANIGQASPVYATV